MISDYEQLRKDNIERNNSFLQSIGVTITNKEKVRDKKARDSSQVSIPSDFQARRGRSAHNQQQNKKINVPSLVTRRIPEKGKTLSVKRPHINAERRSTSPLRQHDESTRPESPLTKGTTVTDSRCLIYDANISHSKLISHEMLKRCVSETSYATESRLRKVVAFINR